MLLYYLVNTTELIVTIHSKKIPFLVKEDDHRVWITGH